MKTYLYVTLCMLSTVSPILSQESNARARAAMAIGSPTMDAPVAVVTSPSEPKCVCGCADGKDCTCGLKCPDILLKKEKGGTKEKSLPTSTIEWRDYDAGMAEAEKKGLPTLVYLRNVNCAYCSALETEFQDPQVVSLVSQGYVPIQVNGDARPDLVHSMGVQAYPVVAVFASNRDYRASRRGYMTRGALYNFLHPFARTTATSTVYTTPYTTFSSMPLGTPQVVYNAFPQVQATYAYPQSFGGFYGAPVRSYGTLKGGACAGGSCR